MKGQLNKMKDKQNIYLMRFWIMSSFEYLNYPLIVFF